MIDFAFEKNFNDDVADFAFDKSAEISTQIYELITNVDENKYFKQVFNSFELLPIERAITLRTHLT